MKKTLFLLVLALAGLAYGFASAQANQNPYFDDNGNLIRNWTDETSPHYGRPPWHWKPNPVWLPSYVACKLDIGIHHTKSGYLFRNPARKGLYFAASSLFGAAGGCILSILIIFLGAQSNKREKQTRPS